MTVPRRGSATPGRRLLRLTLVALLLAPIPARAQRASYTVGPAAYEKLEKAMGQLAEERYAEARKVLDELSRKKLNPHERALMYQTLGFVEAGLDRYPAAIAALEKCLAEDALPPAAQQNVQFNLAQLMMAEERYAEATRLLERWFRETESPTPLAYHLLAVAYYQQEELDRALPPARKAVELSDDPQEGWLSLLLALTIERREYALALPLLERLISRFPRKGYWLQLAALYGELGREKDSLAAMQLAYEQGLLETDQELRNLARLDLYHEIPYRAAHVLEEGLARNRIEGDAESWELLANAWIAAREYEKALEPLTRAARLSGDGKLFLRLGQVHAEREEWAKASQALRQALAKGGLDDPGRVHLLLGIASYNQERLDEAAAEFVLAQQSEKSRKAASQWLRHVERTMQREEVGP
jgi:tetratricopeptide (TPR) repeat protein